MKQSKFLKRSAVMAALLAACSMAGFSAQAANLVYCSEGSPEGFDSWQYTGGTTFDAASEMLFSRLVQFERGGSKVVPDLAEKWSISPDGKVYTFNLRKGVKFASTDGFKPTRDFNADDVVATFNRALQGKENAFNKAYPAEFPYSDDMGLPSNVAKVEKVNDSTVKITLKAVEAPFLQNLAMPFAIIHSAEYMDKLLATGKAAEINTAPVGTGPWILKSYQKDSQIRYVKNTNYYNAKDIHFDNVVFSINKDASVRLQKVKAGECNIMAYPRPAEVQQAKTDPKLAVVSQAGFNVGYVGYNTKKPNLNKLEVRQALDMAINKDAIINAVYQGSGVKATNPMPPTQWSYNKSLKDAAYNPEAAKELLKKAGLPGGFEVNLWALPVQRPYNPNGKLMAEMLQSDWAKIGVKAKIMSYEWSEYLKRAKTGEPDIITVGWTGDNGDPDNWLGALLSCEAVGGSNYAQWCYKPFDDLVVQGKRTNDIAKRTKLYEQAQVIFKQQLPWTTMAHSVVSVVGQKSLQGFKMSPFGTMSFSGVSLK